MSKYKTKSVNDEEKEKLKKSTKSKERALSPYEKKKAKEKKMMEDLKQRVMDKEAKRLEIEKRKETKGRPQSQQEEAPAYIKVADP